MNSLEQLIRWEIKEKGAISFARFMELALYHPEWGYYSRENAEKHVGREGDFFTSVSVGPLFGKLLAAQFANWWKEIGEPSPFHIVECGGLDGTLTHDLLSELRKSWPGCAKAARYILAEPLPRLMARQKEKLKNDPAVSWTDSLKTLPPISGIIFGNELLDSFPIHLLEWKGKWKESCVALEDGRLGWSHLPCPDSWTATIPENFRGSLEHNPLALQWLREASGVLLKGRVLLLDYGWTDGECFQVARTRGTIRAYRNHRMEESLLSEPGRQDLTAHVRWTPLMEEAGILGFKVEDFIQQGRWLTRIIAKNRMELDPTEIRQFQTLTHPDMMGTPFRALVLEK